MCFICEKLAVQDPECKTRFFNLSQNAPNRVAISFGSSWELDISWIAFGDSEMKLSLAFFILLGYVSTWFGSRNDIGTALEQFAIFWLFSPVYWAITPPFYIWVHHMHCHHYFCSFSMDIYRLVWKVRLKCQARCWSRSNLVISTFMFYFSRNAD